jgi:hypothetical protein
MASADIPADIQGGAIIMKRFIRLFVISLAFPGVLLLTGCTGYGGGYSSGNYSVYSGYGYPYYGNGGYYYDDDDHHHRPNRPDRPDRPDRPVSPERPVNLPAQRPGGGMNRPGGGMGRPAGMSRGGGGGRRR